MPASGVSRADVAAAFKPRATLGPSFRPEGTARSSSPSTVIDTAAIRNPAAAVPGLKIAGIRKKDGRTPLYGLAPQLVRVSMGPAAHACPRKPPANAMSSRRSASRTWG